MSTFALPLALLLAFPLRSTASWIRYPKDIDWTPLAVLESHSVTNWGFTASSNALITVDGVFQSGNSFSVEFPIGTGREIILRNGDSKVTSFRPCSSLGFRPLHASRHDFDGNGLVDVKVVFSSLGLAGHGNVAYVHYFFQHRTAWHMLSFYVRDDSYTWEVDLDGDGKYELLKGHHQDLAESGYHDEVTDKWVRGFRKYLFINAYELKGYGLRLCNDMSDALPKILCFRDTDPFGASRSQEFIKRNEFGVPDNYVYQVKRTSKYQPTIIPNASGRE